MTAAASLNLDWPEAYDNFLGLLSSVGSGSESFISFDCFLHGTVFTSKESSLYFFKGLLICLLPIMLIAIFFVFFFFWKLLKNDT
jgi:hypothetical protein